MTPIQLQCDDSPMGRWLLARWSPATPGERLGAVLDGIWYFQGLLAHRRERHFPAGRMELVVHLGPLYRHVKGTLAEPFPETCLSGLLLGPDAIEAPPGPSAVLSVRLGKGSGAATGPGRPARPRPGCQHRPG